MNLTLINYFQLVTEHSRSLWLQNPGSQVIITSLLSIANAWGMIDNMINQVLQPRALKVV